MNLEELLARMTPAQRASYEKAIEGMSLLDEDKIPYAYNALNQSSEDSSITLKSEPSAKSKLLADLDRMDLPEDVKADFKERVRLIFEGVSNADQQAIADRIRSFQAGGKSVLETLLSQSRANVAKKQEADNDKAFDDYFKNNILVPIDASIASSGAGIVKSTLEDTKSALLQAKGSMLAQYRNWRANKLAEDPLAASRINIEGPALFAKENWGLFDAAIVPTSARYGMPGTTHNVSDALNRSVNDSVGNARIAADRSDALVSTLTSYIQQARNAGAASTDAEVAQAYARLADSITSSQSRLIADYKQNANVYEPDQYLDLKLPGMLQLNMLGSGFEQAIVQGSAQASLVGIFGAIQQKGVLMDERKKQTEALKAQQGAQGAANKGVAKTAADIRGMFADRPDLGLKAEVAHRNNLIADPSADPNLAVQQFAGQAEGEKRIAQGLFDAGLDVSALPPEVQKKVMEKGLTAETLPDLISSLPSFKTQFPTGAQFGSKEIVDAMMKKALAEQPGNPILSIQSQLQPSPANPNAPVTPAWADAIGKQAEQMGVSPTALAKAATGNPEAVLQEQNVRQNNLVAQYRELARKWGVTPQQINDVVLKNFLPSGLHDARGNRLLPEDLEPDQFVAQKFQSGEADIRTVLGGLIKPEYQQAYKGIPATANVEQLKKYSALFPEPPTPEEQAKKVRQTQSGIRPRQVA